MVEDKKISFNKNKAKLLGSLLIFTQVFYKLRTGREFIISNPNGRESHHISISRVLTKTAHHKNKRLLIACPPRYGKTEFAIHYIAWMLAHYPDSNFLYVSYSHSLAKRQTQIIRQIVGLPQYRNWFGVNISKESKAKDNFETQQGGSIYASGAGGTITGRGAGIQNVNRFGGAIIIDDIHKPIEIHSDTQREKIKDWYFNTLQSRLNNPKTPIIFIGQRLHEDDLAGNLINKYDGQNWNPLILKALSETKIALHPTMHSTDELLTMQEKYPYEFASQYQQTPQPAGGGIFKADWLYALIEEPSFQSTFITVDTAETNKTYNDATVFSFWGIYKIKQEGVETNLLGLHWIDCYQCWVEPKDLKDEFLSFYRECLRHDMAPKLAAIEKKSTGTTLVSILKDIQGLQILDIERSKASGGKTQRFLNIQSYLSSKRVSITQAASHEVLVRDHIKKITANETHRFDDIADTLADAVNLALIEKNSILCVRDNSHNEKVVNQLAHTFNKRLQLGQKTWRT